MSNLFPHRAALFATLLLGVPGSMPAAHAQIGPMDPSQMMSRTAHEAPQITNKELAAPPALPGAATRSGAAAPATRIPQDLSPNDALFDAINRGDVAAARDALGRGADLRAHNVLSMTPMEVAVDLGRNDISFLLLSYREGNKPGGDRPADESAFASAPASHPRPSPPKAVQGAHVIPAKAVMPVPAPVAQQVPRLFANDGGNPVPSAGFLGFGSGTSPR